ncbi:MAG: MFS transporter [Streptosporangiales bacterium]|nr:MFS transporter [Streptosporangiales bacterium]
MTATIRQEDVVRKRRRAVISGGFGNLLENYDNVIYTYFAATLAKLFFPSSSDAAALLATFGVFAVGFVIRPLGALFFGHLGDRYGRRRALIVSVVLMAIATTAIGLLPTFAAIGVAAPILLVLARLVQGFSVGGEWAGSAALLVEYAPAGKRGRFGSVQQVSTGIGFLLAAAVAAAITLFVDPADILSWGWRIPFLLGLVTGAAALWLRLGLDETPAFKETVAEGETVANPLVTGLRTQRAAIAKGFGFTVLWTLAYFLFLTYVPTFLTEVVGVAETTAKVSNVVALVVFVALIPVTGALSDRVGRKPLLLTASAGFVLLSVPVLLLLNTGQTALVILGQLIVAVLLACFSGPGPAAISELFPTEVRYSALSIGYNFSVMAFGGTAPFVATFLIDKTGWNIAPALMPTAAALITGAVVMSMRETAHKPLR